MTPTNTSTLKEALKPCPFCGGRATSGRSPGCRWSVVCRNLKCKALCQVFVDRTTTDADAKAEAERIWNTRHHTEGKPAVDETDRIKAMRLALIHLWNDKGVPAHDGDLPTTEELRVMLRAAQPAVEAQGVDHETRSEFFRIISLLQDRLQKTTNHLRRNGISKRLVKEGDRVRAESVERLEALLAKLPSSTPQPKPPADDAQGDSWYDRYWSSHAEVGRLREEIEALQTQHKPQVSEGVLHKRDEFIVSKGLWHEFAEWLQEHGA